MSALFPVNAERSNSKVAAIFDDEASARTIANALRIELGLAPGQAQVVAPHDRRPGRKRLPDGGCGVRILVRAHYRLGIAGLAVGTLAWLALRAAEVTAVLSSPGLSAALIIGYGGIFGLMASRLVSLRPDQDPCLIKVRHALREGRSAVVVHVDTPEQRDLAERTLSDCGGETIRTP